MCSRSWRLFGAVLMLAAGTALAQEGQEQEGRRNRDRRGGGQEGRFERGGQEGRFGRGGPGGPGGPGFGFRMAPEAQLRMLTEELKLDDEQQEHIGKLLTENSEKMRELMESAMPPEDMRERMREFRESMMEAREAGDEARMQELREEFEKARQEMDERMAPVREKQAAMQKELHDGIVKVLHEEQVEKFEAVWRERMAARRQGPDRSPRAVMAAVNRLRDVTDDQKQQVEDLFAAFREAQRDQADNRQAVQRLENKFYDDVLKILTEEQREQVQRQLQGRGGRGGEGGRFGDPDRPRVRRRGGADPDRDG